MLFDKFWGDLLWLKLKLEIRISLLVKKENKTGISLGF